MNAVHVVGYHQKMQLTQISDPEISGLLDVIVRIGGAGVCRADLHILEGHWAEKSGVALHSTIGHENPGWVHAVGSSGSNVAVGDKVIVHPLVTCGLCRACRSGDDSLEPADVAALADAGLTAYRAVAKSTRLIRPGHFAVMMDSGGLGHIGAQVSRAVRGGVGKFYVVGYGENIDVPTIDIISAEIKIIGNLIGS